MSGQRKTAGIIIIGNEILTGKIQDENGRFLIGELHQLGVAVRRLIVLPDEVDEIARSVREYAAQFDLVFTSGGVGPTHDDLTILGVARAFGRPVIRHPEMARLIQELFGQNLDEARLRMADVPEGATLISGAALRWPVVSVENVYIFPGVPEILRGKFRAIRERFREPPFYIAQVFTQEDEFDLAPRLSCLAATHPQVNIGSYPAFASQEYRTRITLESALPQPVEDSMAELLQVLNPTGIVRLLRPATPPEQE